MSFVNLCIVLVVIVCGCARGANLPDGTAGQSGTGGASGVGDIAGVGGNAGSGGVAGSVDAGGTGGIGGTGGTNSAGTGGVGGTGGTGGGAGSEMHLPDGGVDASNGPDASGVGVCGGSTPHGCYVAKPDNPIGCPPQIHEQSAYYPPGNEWVACTSPNYVPCNYTRPDGTDANCSCDLGLHWLCTY